MGRPDGPWHAPGWCCIRCPWAAAVRQSTRSAATLAVRTPWPSGGQTRRRSMWCRPGTPGSPTSRSRSRPAGGRKQLSYTCVLSATVRRVSLPIDQPTNEVDLLLEDTTAVVTAGKLDSLGLEDIGGRRFARYRTPPLAPRAGVTIAFTE